MMNAAEKTQSYSTPVQNSTLIISHPHSYQDVKSDISRMENRHVILFNIEKISKEDLFRSLDYLAGFTDCCAGTLSRMSSSLVLVAPNGVLVDDGDSFVRL